MEVPGWQRPWALRPGRVAHPGGPAGALCCLGRVTAPGCVLALAYLLYAVVLGGLMFPHLRSDACKKLKMAILGQEKAGGKEDFALLRFPV